MKRIILVDYGSQYTRLFVSRLREQECEPKIVKPNAPLSSFKNAAGLILSGGPHSVYKKGSPQLSRALTRLIFDEELPTLAVCYGMQLVSNYAAKKYYPAVRCQEGGEYGKADLEVSYDMGVLKDLKEQEIVWMSHGDYVDLLPPNFQRLASSKNCRLAAITHITKPIFGLQFHPEVSQTRSGRKILKNFLEICDAEQNWNAEEELARLKRKTKRQIGARHVFAFISGGNDSSVLARFLQKIVPQDRLHFYYVRGLGSDEDLEKIKLVSDDFHVVDARRRIYRALKGVVDPEEKRQIIGKIFLQIWQKETKKLAADLELSAENLILAQGTIYSDVIESGGSQHASKIKSHHNTVLRELLGVARIIEPFRNLFKPDVRKIGRLLEVDERLISQHPSPGPGYAVRFLCSDESLAPSEELFFSVMSHKYEMQEICRAAGYRSWVLPIKSKGVQGDHDSYAYTVGITGPYARGPLLELATLIPNHFKGLINRVVYLVAPDYSEYSCYEKVALKKDYFKAKTRNIADRANKVFIYHLRLANLYPLISQAFAVVAPLSFDMQGYTVIIRAVNTEDYMTAEPYWLPWPFLKKVTDEILRQVPEVQIVAYDITSKPPGTIEWE